MIPSGIHLERSHASLWGMSLLVSLLINGAVLVLVFVMGASPDSKLQPDSGATDMPRGRVVELSLRLDEPETLVEEAPAPSDVSRASEIREDGAPAERMAPVRFSRTDESQKAVDAPVAALFISDRNTRAASDRSPDAVASNLPAQTGSESNFGELDTLAAGGLPSRETDSDTQSRESGASRGEVRPFSLSSMTPSGEAINDTAVAKAAESGVAKAGEIPERLENLPEGESPTARKTRSRGSVAQADHSAVDAVDTPLGRYQAVVLRAVEEEWLKNGERYQKFITAGFMTVRFSLGSDGKVRSLTVVEAIQCSDPQKGYTLGSIRTAKIPPIPRELKRELGKAQLQLSMTFSFPSL